MRDDNYNLTFQKAQAKLEANRRGGKGAVKKIHPETPIEDYWLSGKLYCGLCGGTVQGMIGDVNNPDTRRQLLEFFVDKIYVYTDKVAIVFYFSDDRRELPFEETEALIDSQQRLLDMVNSHDLPADTSAWGIKLPFEYKDEDEDEGTNSDYSP